MRRLLFVVLLLALPLPAFSAPAAVRLGAGDATFWSGPSVETAGRNWTYHLEVTEPGYRLRIAVDHPYAGDNFTARIQGPDGETGSLSSGSGLYSAEYLRESPNVGRWTITVTAARITNKTAFRLRAKLEGRPPPLGTRKGPVLPNLQVLPPHEASFLFPVSNGNTPDDQIGLDVLGRASCHPEEHVEEQALRCLRFGFGVRNTGRGPMNLFAVGAQFQDRDLIQRIELAEGGFIERDAGMARFHKSHGHYHHHDAVALQLFKVTDPKRGRLEPAGDKHFKGFAHRDELLRDWHAFYPTWSKTGFGLLAGWADIYEWDRPGNYIDFGLNPDGRYVVRMWADPVEGVLEANERDNVGYTYLEVAGNDVTLLESGRGSDPWDPCKILVGFGGEPDPKTGSRPAGCPPDTT